MRKLVAAAICLLSLSLSVTTGRKCIKEARTRTGKKCCEQQLRRVDKALSRAGDIPEGSWICLSHRNLILAEDKRCSMFLQFLAHAQTFDCGVIAGKPRTASAYGHAVNKQAIFLVLKKREPTNITKPQHKYTNKQANELFD